MWKNRVFKRINLTNGFVSNLLSLFGSKDSIEQIECDETRHILYTLSKASRISVYNLGNHGTKFIHVVSYHISTLQVRFRFKFSLSLLLPLSERDWPAIQYCTGAAQRHHFNHADYVNTIDVCHSVGNNEKRLSDLLHLLQ